MLLAVGLSAIVFAAAVGGPTRLVLAIGAAAFIVLCTVVGTGVLLVVAGGLTAARLSPQHVVRAATLPYRVWFRARWGRLMPGQRQTSIQRLLGRPTRIHGFGDRLYWSYHVAGEQFVVALDPRRLIAKYGDGLSRDGWSTDSAAVRTRRPAPRLSLLSHSG